MRTILLALACLCVMVGAASADDLATPGRGISGLASGADFDPVGDRDRPTNERDVAPAVANSGSPLPQRLPPNLHGFAMPDIRALTVSTPDDDQIPSAGTRPTALASGDFDGDGVSDLICAGHASNVLTLHRGNVDSIFPHSAAARQRRDAGTSTDQPFLTPAAVFDAPVRPDFVGVGDFDNDGELDLVVGAQDGRVLHLLDGDGAGGFHVGETIELPGALTTMTTGEINRRDGLADLVVGVNGPDGPSLLVFEGPDGALRAEAEVIRVPTAPNALLLARLGDGPWIDLAVAAGDELLIVRGRDRGLSLGEEQRAQVEPPVVQRVAMPSRIESLAWGDFAWEAIETRELALLLDDGTIRLLDSRGETIGRRDGLISRQGSAASSPSLLLPVRLSGAPTEDLAIVDRRDGRLLVLAGMVLEDSPAQGGTGMAAEGIVGSIDLTVPPIAALPMRLNRDALTDLVLLQEDTGAPVLAETAPLATITVNTNLDTATAGDGSCSLREAINNSNSNSDTTGGDCATGAGVDAIEFNIAGGGAPAAIAPASALPPITDAVTIDGTTQDCVGPPCVVLDGSGAGFVPAGLSIEAGSSAIRGLVVNNFLGNNMTGTLGLGLFLTSSGNVVEGNYIGTNITGTVAMGNTAAGIRIEDGSNNTIGGTLPLARNVASGSIDANGINVAQIAGTASDNLVIGNLVGTDRTGTVGLGNTFDGVVVNGASNNTIGGTTVGARNVISANGDDGVRISDGTGNQILGNFIGIDASGTVALGNGTIDEFGDGVLLNTGASSNTIGGTAAGAGNVISSNGAAGIFLDSAPENLVQGNLIGTDVNGTVDLGNVRSGVEFLDNSPSNTIGGTTAGARNVISGNGESGIFTNQADVQGSLVLGNYIGTDAAGTSALGNSPVGVLVNSSDLTIGGLSSGARNIISGNVGNGIFLVGPGSGNVVLGNYLGTDVTGTSALGNGFSGVEIDGLSNGNTVGGATAGAGNLISGNAEGGMFIELGVDNTVSGNLIGTDVTGTTSLGNGTFPGVEVWDSDNMIGGVMPGAGNVISGHASDGITFFGAGATSNEVLGNFIGTDISGTFDLGNGAAGIRVQDSTNNTIGGATTGARNIISGNGTDGVGIFGDGSQGNVVLGNFIGTDVTGTVAMGNLLAGVEIELGSNNIVGGAVDGAGNVISGNGDVQGWGIAIQTASNNQILGNIIGFAADGTSPLGNRLAGVGLADGASNNTIGGTGVTPGRCDGPCNRIGNTAQPLNDGVRVLVGAGNGNAILGNSIRSNAELAIDLEGSGVTPNDPADPDAGANEVQNYPVLSLAEATPAGVTVEGTLNSTPNRAFRIEFFGNDTCDGSGHGEGATFLGFTTVLTNPAGDAGFSGVLPAGVSDGDSVTATATSQTTNSTSEFSACVEAVCLELAIFGQTIEAADRNSFEWNSPADVRFTKGNLADVDGYVVSASGDLFDATSLDMSLDFPVSGEGLYYVVRPRDCGSWQTVADAEPGRDGALP